VVGLSPRAGQITSGFDCLDLVGLSPLMARTSGRPEISIALIDGPVAKNHPDLRAKNIREIPGDIPGSCDGKNTACAHGTFVAGVLIARRGSVAPAICPGCSLLVRPIFAEAIPEGEVVPGATAEQLAEAIIEVTDAGARIVNLSLAIQGPSSRGEKALEQALNYALRRGVLVIAAAGNQGAVGSSAITRHPWIIPVVAYHLRGRPMDISNLGASIGRCGLGAPGDAITSLGAMTERVTMGGTSVATPFVTGAVALMWSEFPNATAAEVRSAVTQAGVRRRTAPVPPLLNAWAGYQALSRAHS
jgi:subtilisin family serine protease